MYGLFGTQRQTLPNHRRRTLDRAGCSYVMGSYSSNLSLGTTLMGSHFVDN